MPRHRLGRSICRLNSEHGAVRDLFLWQFRIHAIAWMYREDYDRAGYLVLPRARRDSFGRWNLLRCLLVAISIVQFRRARAIFTAQRTVGSRFLTLDGIRASAVATPHADCSASIVYLHCFSTKRDAVHQRETDRFRHARCSADNRDDELESESRQSESFRIKFGSALLKIRAHQ